MAEIRELAKAFIGIGQVRGFKFTQISKTDCGFLYEVDTGDMTYYEVFQKLINHRFGCVSYPTNKAFGIWAWTTPSLNRAYKILNELNSEKTNLHYTEQTYNCQRSRSCQKSFV